ncbi:hypothetical protein KA082_02035 [Candidatus Woesebacteria bacterium]|nr:hypothetical protein [Candidatus Woesebacteria bacterium]
MPKSFGYKIKTPNGPIEGQIVSLSTRAVLEEGEKRGVTWKEIPNARIFRLEYNGITRYLHYQMPTQTLELGFNICLNKAAAKEFLQEAQVATPKGYYIPKQITDETAWLDIFNALKKPLVIKPSHGKQGQSVYMDIQDKNAFISAVTAVMQLSREDEEGVLVEETFEGKEYRILATKEKVLGIINRVPANVTGDGIHTIEELVAEKNNDPRRSFDIYDPLVKIPIDTHVHEYLTKHGRKLSDIPSSGEQVFLRQNSNISTGGDSYDVTDIADPSVHAIALKVSNAIPGAYFLGIDFMTTDISTPQTEETYSIIEVNGSPGLSIHDWPFVGESRDCAKELLFLIFPELR